MLSVDASYAAGTAGHTEQPALVKSQVAALASSSYWENMLYGLGAAALFGAPFLLPHQDDRFVFEFYLALVGVSYGYFCVWGIAKAIARPKLKSRR